LQAVSGFGVIARSKEDLICLVTLRRALQMPAIHVTHAFLRLGKGQFFPLGRSVCRRIVIKAIGCIGVSGSDDAGLLKIQRRIVSGGGRQAAKFRIVSNASSG